ncbi:MAG: bifunctional helix-turn-helix transcriptional regulator/GNAT family N-acetyltransferase [bacterium]
MDNVKELKELAFATRLKRLSDRLTKDVSLLYNKMNIDFEAKWFAIISILRDHSPMTITEIAGRLGVTHTAVNNLAEELLKKGYITSVKGHEDERQRLLSINESGKKLCKKLEPIWEEIKLANKELIDKIDPYLLANIGRIEEELDRLSIYERVWKNIFGTLPGQLKVLLYSPKMKKHFQKLNYEWLEEYFTVEDKDKNILLHPKEIIINNGGTIFFALFDDEVVGTCAVIKHMNNKYELAKMAVTKKHQNCGIGKLLLESAVNWVKEIGENELYLLTCENLVSANILYRNFGFVRLKQNPFNDTQYVRKTYAMKLDLIKTNNLKA